MKNNVKNVCNVFFIIINYLKYIRSLDFINVLCKNILYINL